MRSRSRPGDAPQTVKSGRKAGSPRSCPLSMLGASPILFPMVDREASQRGISVVEILIVLIVAAVACGGLYSYMGATKKSLDTVNTGRPLGHARLAADLATLAAIRNQLDLH